MRRIKRRRKKQIKRRETRPEFLLFTRQRRMKIYAAFRLRLPVKSVCNIVGMTPVGLRGWLNKGKDKEKYPIHYTFRKQVKRIQEGNIGNALQIIEEAAKGGKPIKEVKTVRGPKGLEVTRIRKKTLGNWTAAAWWLERTVSEIYGRDTGKLDPQSTEDNARAVKEHIDKLFASVPLKPSDQRNVTLENAG